MTTVFLSSLAWALVLITSAIVLKGHPAEEWVQAALYIGALTVLMFHANRLSCRH
ncbi:MAG TPA: hypothetical protein VM656_03930 [Pyrinomonadaceae bacterium]|nr:hypothetical protein [Pyrinomonadaceae bacterium]